MGSQYKETVRMKPDENQLRFCRQGFGGVVGVIERGMYREKHQELGRSTLLLSFFRERKVAIFNCMEK